MWRPEVNISTCKYTLGGLNFPIQRNGVTSQRYTLNIQKQLLDGGEREHRFTQTKQALHHPWLPMGARKTCVGGVMAAMKDALYVVLTQRFFHLEEERKDKESSTLLKGTTLA